jgi:hypothetical protein
MVIVLIPLLGYIYNKYHRRVITSFFFLIGIGASLIPVIYVSLKYKVESFPGFGSNAYSDMYTKLYFRIPPFLMGIALGIFHFEYRHVDKLNDGSKPFHRDYIQKMIKKYPRAFNFICYFIGWVFIVGTLGALVYNSNCIKKVEMSTVYLKKDDIKYCWNEVGGAIYYALSPIFFYFGLTVIILPCLIGISSILRPLMNSHLWHIMEELTFQAFLLQYLVVIWFFASREQNTLLSAGYIIQITVSSWILSYLIAIPFYMIVERPFKNFLDLILFPKSSIFKKQKDLDDEDEESSDSGDEKTAASSQLKKQSSHVQIKCGFCQDDTGCDCQCLITKKKCKCANQPKNQGVVRRQLKDTSEEIMIGGGGKEDSVIESTVKGTFVNGNANNALTKSELMEKKRVSFDVAHMFK